MNRWNSYMNNHFKDCQQIGQFFDPHHGHMVKVFKIPGDVENVGLSTTVDAWVALKSVLRFTPITTDDTEVVPRETTRKKISRARVQLPADLL